MTPLSQKVRGFSLVELMIAMTLGLFLMAGMIAVFAGNKRSSELNTAMANIQENARFALDAMSRRARMAGYQGCLPPTAMTLQSQTTATPTTNLLETAVMGALVEGQQSWKPAPPPQMTLPLSVKAVPGTHVLVLMGGTGVIGRLQQAQKVGGVPNAAAPLIVEGINRDFFVGATAIAADCSIAQAFQVTGINYNGGNTQLQHAAPANDAAAFNVVFGSGDGSTVSETRVMRLTSDVYFVGDTGLENEQGDPVYALYLQTYPYNDAENPPVEIVQGVENMRISFGINRNRSVQFVTPDDAAFDPSLVHTIRVGLLMSSYDRIAPQDDKTTYVLAGQEIKASKQSNDGNTHAQDRRFRLAFNTTIKVRNRRN